MEVSFDTIEGRTKERGILRELEIIIVVLVAAAVKTVLLFVEFGMNRELIRFVNIIFMADQYRNR